MSRKKTRRAPKTEERPGPDGRVLRRIKVTNYRSLREVELELGPITVLVGPTDSGKTNLVRALSDWSVNRIGLDCLTWGKDVSRVGVTLADETIVLWQKGKAGINSYGVRSPDGQETDFPKAGRGCPPEVSALTNFFRVHVGESFSFSPNFGFQQEGWFLLSGSWTPTTTARLLSVISGLDHTLAAIRKVQQRLTGYRSKESQEEAEVGRIEERIAGLPDLEAARRRLDEARETKRDIAALRSRIDEASRLRERIFDRERMIKRYRSRVVPAAKKMKKVDLQSYIDGVEVLKEARAARAELLRVAERLKASRERLKAASVELVEEQDRLFDLAEAMDLCPVCGGPAHEGCRDRIQDESRESIPKG